MPTHGACKFGFRQDHARSGAFALVITISRSENASGLWLMGTRANYSGLAYYSKLATVLLAYISLSARKN